MPPLLENLTNPEFEAQFVASTPRALRTMLKASEEVAQIREAYDAGSLTGEDIRSFVERKLQESRALVRFPYEVLLAALAVALESRYDQFAEEYLQDLARLKRGTRFPIASRVAELSIGQRTQGIASTGGTFEVLLGYLHNPPPFSAHRYEEGSYARYSPRVVVNG